MPSIRRLLVRLRPDVRLPEPLADAAPTAAAKPARDDHRAPTVRPVKVDEPPRTILVSPKPPEPSPRLQPDPTAPAPELLDALPADGPRVSKLDALTPVLGRKKAGQALWAPDLLTKAERVIAARIIADIEEADRG